MCLVLGTVRVRSTRATMLACCTLLISSRLTFPPREGGTPGEGEGFLLRVLTLAALHTWLRASHTLGARILTLATQASHPSYARLALAACAYSPRPTDPARRLALVSLARIIVPSVISFHNSVRPNLQFRAPYGSARYRHVDGCAPTESARGTETEDEDQAQLGPEDGVGGTRSGSGGDARTRGGAGPEPGE